MCGYRCSTPSLAALAAQVLNRVRSAETHNVFDRFADWELEQLALLFARFDTDHDGVLEFADFCRVMLRATHSAPLPYQTRRPPPIKRAHCVCQVMLLVTYKTSALCVSSGDAPRR